MNDHLNRSEPQLQLSIEAKSSGSDLVLAGVGGAPMADSRTVAEKFGKRHADVLRKIDSLECSKEFTERNFAFSEYQDVTGRKLPYCSMTRDGFTFLVMGFTGKKAAIWKEQFIRAFNMMEAKLRSPQPVFDPSDPKVLLACFEHLQGQVAEKEEIIEEQGQRLEKLDRIEGAEGDRCITDAAKLLKVRPRDLFSFMQSRRWIYKRAGCKYWNAHQDKTNAGYLSTKDHLYIDSTGMERFSQAVVVTPKGLIKLSELLNQPLH